MTFLKFLLLKAKNTPANYWKVLGLRIFVRLLGITTVIYLLNLLSSETVYGEKYFYSAFPPFYLLFIIFLDGYLKVIPDEKLNNKTLKLLNVLKWIPLCFTVILIYLTFKLNPSVWPEETAQYIIYSYSHVWPMVFVPNLGFIIITTLIFYAAEILKKNRTLKEENDLTI